MPLPTLTWRAFPPVVLAANTTAAILDAIQANASVATYADGSPRQPSGTPGSTSWTWNKEQSGGVTVAAYGSPPPVVAPDATIPTSYIIAGASSLPPSGPTMLTTLGVTPDSNAVNRLNIAMVKNPGAYIGGGVGWYAANPFTSGSFSGYVNLTQATTIVTFATLRMWECQEAFICQLLTAGGTASYPFGGGALIDPLSTTATDDETDGRLYSMFAVGSGGAMSTSSLSNSVATQYGPFIGRTGANNSRFQTFTPGTAVTVPHTRFGIWAGLTTSLTSPNGDLPKIPFPLYATGTTTSFGPVLGAAGQLRQIYITRNSLAGTAWTNGATTVGYLLGANQTAAAEAMLLAY
jgi:hypothetical protein